MAIHPSRFSGRSLNKPTITKVRTGRSRRWRPVLGFIFLLPVIALVAWLGWGILSGPPSLPNEKYYPIRTNYKERTNLLLVSFNTDEPFFIAVASVSNLGKVKWLKLDPMLTLDLARGNGNYRLAGAWKLGNLDQRQGMNLLRDSVSRALAIPIDGYIAVHQDGWNNLKIRYGGSADQIIASLSSPLFWLQFVANPWPADLSSSLASSEVIGILRRVRSSGGVSELSLDQTTVPIPDAPGLYTIDPASFDGRVGREFQESDIAQIHPRVRIINASDIPGAAVEMARYVRNLGGEVTSLESADSTKKSTVRDHHGGSQLARRLASLIGGETSIDHQGGRSDIEVTIGKDAKSWF